MKGNSGLAPENLAKLCRQIALDKKAEDAMILDVRGISTVADFFFICTGTSEPHLKAIADEICRRLRDEGIPVGVFAMPIVPWLTDREEDLDNLAYAAREADAQWLGARVLYLMPDAWKTFLSFLEAKFPRLVTRYREWYGRNVDAPESYRKEMAARIEKLRQKYGLSSRPLAPSGESWRSPQMQLALYQGENACQT